MAKKALIIIFSLLATLTMAQVPQGFIYQGVAHSFDGKPVANQQITVEVTILQGTDCTSGCTTVWQELHYPTTNELGVFTIEIGNGQSTYAGTAASFSDINWADRTAGDYYLRIRVDFGASQYGNSLIDLGTSKILSVPYALVSDQASTLVRTAGKVDIGIGELNDVTLGTLNTNDMLIWDGTQWVNQPAPSSAVLGLNDLSDVTITSPTQSQALMYNSSTGEWNNTTLLLNTISDVSILTPSANQVLAFDGTNWTNQNINLSGLSDVSLGTLNSGDVLTYNGTSWTNSALLWKSSASAVYLDTAYSKHLPVLIGKLSPTGTANFYDSIGTGDFVIEGLGSNTQTTNIYPNASFVYYGDFGSLIVGKSNINTTNPRVGISTFIIGHDNDYQGGNNIFIAGNYNQTQQTSLLYFPNNAAILGNNNTLNSYAENSLVVGNNNSVSQKFNFVFGLNNYVWAATSADSLFTLTVGSDNQNLANYGITMGKGLINKSFAALIIGQYNLASDTTSLTDWIADDPVFVVGNGTDDLNRSNVFLIKKNGDLFTKGNIYQAYTGTFPAKKSVTSVLPQIMNLKVDFDGKEFYLNPTSVKKQFPSLVKTFDNQYAINTVNLVPALIKTIQEQQQIIEKQQKQIDDLEQRLQRLEKIVSQLK